MAFRIKTAAEKILRCSHRYSHTMRFPIAYIIFRHNFHKTKVPDDKKERYDLAEALKYDMSILDYIRSINAPR